MGMYLESLTYKTKLADAKAGSKIDCPLLVLWGEASEQGSRYDMTAVWREYATDVRAQPVHCGHFIAEEAPADTVTALGEFFSGDPQT